MTSLRRARREKSNGVKITPNDLRMRKLPLILDLVDGRSRILKSSWRRQRHLYTGIQVLRRFETVVSHWLCHGSYANKPRLPQTCPWEVSCLWSARLATVGEYAWMEYRALSLRSRHNDLLAWVFLSMLSVWKSCREVGQARDSLPCSCSCLVYSAAIYVLWVHLFVWV